MSRGVTRKLPPADWFGYSEDYLVRTTPFSFLISPSDAISFLFSLSLHNSFTGMIYCRWQGSSFPFLLCNMTQEEDALSWSSLGFFIKEHLMRV